jgi:hypothetical protein
MATCRRCGCGVEAAYRFCPWCAAPLRSKLVELFRTHPALDPDRALRVSRYVGPDWEEQHVRISIWSEDGRAEAAVSLADDEAERVGRFLLETRPSRPPTLIERVVAAARR